MAAERSAQYISYHQRSSRNLRDALCEPQQTEAVGVTSPDDASPAGLQFGERSAGARRSHLPGSRSREDMLDARDDQDRRPMEDYQDRPAGRPGQVTELTWRENRRLHQSSQIPLAFGSASPRWETSADMGRRYVEFWSRPASPVTPCFLHLTPRCTSSSQLDAAGQRTPLDALHAESRRASSSLSDLLDGGSGGRRHSTDRGRGRDTRDASLVGRSPLAAEEPSARRHRSDLTPTAPPGHSFRDPAPARHRSPGKAVSMSRLDLLAQPRRPLVSRHDQHPAAGQTSPMHVPPPQSGGRRWQSMWHLGPVVAPRPTRATLLRRAARHSPEQGIVGGSPAAGSRPCSQQSQQGTPGTPAGSRTAQLRPRSGARKPRPSSIAGMPNSRQGSDVGTPRTTEGRVSSRSGSSSTPRRPLPASAPSSEARRPAPSAAAPSPRRTPAQVKADDARKKKQRSKSGTPQPETRPNGTQQPGPASESSGGSEPRASPAPSAGSSAEGSTGHPPGVSTEQPPESSTELRAVTPQPEVAGGSEQGDTPSRKAGYDDEAAAKAALAEKRRKAREEAERQAELERQQREEEERQEQERLHQEELMMEQAARAEQERLQKAIEEAEERRAAEERRRQEEDEQRRQREVEEQAAREEAERARIAAAEKLEREEKERRERRSRVAAIMSRTRNAGNSGATDKTADSSEEEQSGLAASEQSSGQSPPPSEGGQSREEGSSLESHASEEIQTRPEETSPAPSASPAPDAAPVTPEPTTERPAEPQDGSLETQDRSLGSLQSEVQQETESLQRRDQDSPPLDQEPRREQDDRSYQEQERDQERGQPMSMDASPTEANGNMSSGIVNGTNGSSGSNSLDNADLTGDSAPQNGGFSALHALVMKPSAASDDEDSINSNVSPRPGSETQDPFSLSGLTGPTPRTQELAHTVHTTELVQL